MFRQTASFLFLRKKRCEKADLSICLRMFCTAAAAHFHERRRWDLNPCTGTSRLLPFQGSPFNLLGTSPWLNSSDMKLSYLYRIHDSGCFLKDGEDGIRTHVPVKANGFQDRLVMTTSIPLRTPEYDSIRRFKSQQIFQRDPQTLTILIQGNPQMSPGSLCSSPGDPSHKYQTIVCGHFRQR